MKGKLDWSILVLCLILFIFSSAFVLSLIPALFKSHLLHIVIGCCFFLIFTYVDYQIFKRFGFFMFFIAVAILLLPFLFPSPTRETLRWIDLGFFNFQPSEFVKPILILAFSWLASFKQWSRKQMLASLIFLTLPAILIFKQPDLGSTMIIFLIWLSIFIFKLNRRYLIYFLSFFLIVFFLAWLVLADYQKDRLVAFFDPLADPLGRGYQMIQAKIAAGSGKLFGRGLFRGTQSHLEFLPERHTDFVFASMAEELGFAGSVFVVLVYFFLLARILKVSQCSSDDFGFYVATGVFAMLAGEIFINIGMNLGLLPITGITLPLVSVGGSSIVSSLISLGLVESIALRSRLEEALEIR